MDVKTEAERYLALTDRSETHLITSTDFDKTETFGPIRIDTKIKGDKIVMSVADTGRGIEPADLPEIWKLWKMPAIL